jgi:DnaJ-class molecular chaperone
MKTDLRKKPHKTCEACGGLGKVNESPREAPVIVQCTKCKGTGKVSLLGRDSAS